MSNEQLAWGAVRSDRLTPASATSVAVASTKDAGELLVPQASCLHVSVFCSLSIQDAGGTPVVREGIRWISL